VLSIEQISDLETAKQVAILLEKENAKLHERLKELSEQIALLRGQSKAVQLEMEIARLQQQMDKLQKELFGRSSERGVKKTDGNAVVKQKVQPKGHGPQPQMNLAIEEREHELDEADQVCELCGGRLQEWSGQTEDSEEITSVKRQYILVKHKRKKYRCSCGSGPVTAPGPLKLISGGRYSLQFAVDIATEKYLEHQPLERQVRMMARQGLTVTSQTLWDQIERLAKVLLPCYRELAVYVRGKQVLNVDETPWPFLDKPNKKWWVWSAASYDAVYYHFDARRSARAAEELIGDFKGTLVVDGYISYESLLKSKEGIVLGFCWSHARRKFLDAKEYYPESCGEILEMIDELFWIERQLPSWEGLKGEELIRTLRVIKDARQIHSQALIKQMERWILEQRAQPGSSLAQAIGYLGEHWKGLTRFIQDPRIPLSNNRAERELRTCALGRKNHYGSRSERGTEVAALFYSLLESAKLCGDNPEQYLLAATKAILTDPTDVLLPHQFAARLLRDQSEN